MKNVFKFLGIALVAVIVFSITACNKNKAPENAITGETPTWRDEFIYYGIDYEMGMWRSGNNRLTFTTEVVKGCVILYAGSGSESSTYRLISKDDQPAGQVSAFTIEDNTGKYTVKYTLPAENLQFFTITDTGGLKPDFISTGTYIHSFWGHDPGPETFIAYLQKVEAALEKARNGNAPKAQIQELENAVAVIQSSFFSERRGEGWQETTAAPELYYATSNLRLGSEPDISKGNRVASVPQGGSVEFLKAGKTETIDGITAPWFMVQTADGTIGWVFSGYLADTAAAATGIYDYTKILNGDLSDFAGTWVDGGDGTKKQLRADGTFNNREKAAGFQRVDNSPVASGGAIYMWGIHIPDEGGYGVMLFPAGVDVKFGGGIFQTDKTKVRISMGHDFDPSSLYYRN